MRYIGSKANLLTEIESVAGRLAGEFADFTDLFAGTGSVAEHFKKYSKITSNDILYFCYVLNSAKVELTKTPDFQDQMKVLGKHPIEFLNDLSIKESEATDLDFVYQEFSPAGASSRSYLSSANALKIDRIRQQISAWEETSFLSREESNYLLACLIDAVPSFSNIAGTYGAFLKHWDDRALKSFQMNALKVRESNFKNVSLNEDSNQLIDKISGDVLYLDTPYNGRQYSSNYHLLETIARYDYPALKGKTGTRQDQSGKSQYCSKLTVHSAFKDLFSRANFNHIIVSYSSEGLLTEEELVDLLLEFGTRSSLIIERIPYRRYKRLASDERGHVMEYLLAVSR